MISALAWLALAFYIGGGLFRMPRAIMACFIAGNISYMIHYLLIGLYPPAISLGMASCITFAILVIPARLLLPTVIFGFTLSTLMIIKSATAPIDLVLIAAASFVYFANFNRNHALRFKMATIAAQLLWVVFSLYHNDIPMLICSGGMALSLGLSLLRYKLWPRGIRPRKAAPCPA